jgi:hypothetical protein
MAHTFWIELSSGRILSSHFDEKGQADDAHAQFEHLLEPNATAETWQRWSGSGTDYERYRLDTVIAYGQHEKADFADVYDKLRRSSYARGSRFST